MTDKFDFYSIFSKPPLAVKEEVPCFCGGREGDQFTKEDVAFWTEGGFERRWKSRGQPSEYHNSVYADLCGQAAELNLPIMDVASGPGLGLIPDILALNPRVQALATDACPVLVEKWSEYLKVYAPNANIRFACLNAADMPVFSDSVDVITSNIGFSSLRYAGADQMLGVREAYRVLKPGGYVFAIENGFEDMAVVQKAFDLWGRENWFGANALTWRQRFIQAGFTVVQEKPHLRRVEKDDWELGEIASSFGLEIVVIFKAYILRKQ